MVHSSVSHGATYTHPPPPFSSQVSLRRQEIADRLSAWTIFNDKNKELCDWLTQMENKVSHSGDLSLEEMVEKLKKVGGNWGMVHILGNNLRYGETE